MTTGFLPPPDLDRFLYCGFTLPSGTICGKPARASVDGPHGEHLSLCATHALNAERLIQDVRWNDWRLRR